ncbi:hypothetical protein HNP00_003508 [Arthrobacter sp. AZCC_0090]|nr:hypothetical protein [Arthrobacter sp. AZCC_0090]
MQPGLIPPAPGPLRDRYLKERGLESLERADRAFWAVDRLLTGSGLQRPPGIDLLETSDDILRRQIQLRAREEWIELRDGLDPQVLDQIEPLIRRSEIAAVEALNYLEDHELAGRAHAAIHNASVVRSGLYGCPIVFEEGVFWTNCSVRISHWRIGLSAGLTVDFVCSICGDPVEDCDHAMGASYEVIAKARSGRCTVCSEEACEHELGQPYIATARRDARNVTPREISFVSRPRYPLARVYEMTVEIDEQDPAYQFAVRGLADCDACLGPCDGFSSLPRN